MADCEYCHEDLDGYVKPIEKNAHAYVAADSLVVSFARQVRVCKINYCPMCGRRLNNGK